MAKNQNIDVAPERMDTKVHNETTVEDHTNAPVDEVEVEYERSTKELTHGTILETIGEPVAGFPEPEAEADEGEAE